MHCYILELPRAATTPPKKKRRRDMTYAIDRRVSRKAKWHCQHTGLTDDQASILMSVLKANTISHGARDEWRIRNEAPPLAFSI